VNDVQSLFSLRINPIRRRSGWLRPSSHPFCIAAVLLENISNRTFEANCTTSGDRDPDEGCFRIEDHGINGNDPQPQKRGVWGVIRHNHLRHQARVEAAKDVGFEQISFRLQ